MKIVFSHLARQEIDDAVNYYESELLGLGSRFRSEVRAAILRIAEFPTSWSLRGPDIRMCLLVHFPYTILYSIESDHIFIIAVAHQRRLPDYWVDE